MRSFDFEKEYSKLLTPDIVSYIAQIHEYRGRYSTDNVQKELLSELLEIARIQSTEASNRIEGIITTDDRLKKIVREKTLPLNLYKSLCSCRIIFELTGIYS